MLSELHIVMDPKGIISIDDSTTPKVSSHPTDDSDSEQRDKMEVITEAQVEESPEKSVKIINLDEYRVSGGIEMFLSQEDEPTKSDRCQLENRLEEDDIQMTT